MVEVSQPQPVIYSGMRGTSTNSTTETTLYTFTTNQTALMVTTMYGHSVVGGVSTFNVRRGSATGTVIASMTGSGTAIGSINNQVVTYETSGTAIYWNAYNTTGGTSYAFYDETTVGNGYSSYSLQASYIVFNSRSTPPMAYAVPFDFVPNRATKFNFIQANTNSSSNSPFYEIIYDNADWTFTNTVTESVQVFTLNNTYVEYIAVCSGSFQNGQALGFSFTGKVLNV